MNAAKNAADDKCSHSIVRGYVAIILFALVATTRLLWVSLYAASVPFFDQWDELYYKFRPWQDGTWQLSQLILPHNEHRVAFTRLIGLALFKVNGGVFDNLVVALVNAFIYAGMWTFTYVLLARTSRRREQWLLFLAIFILASLPFDVDNLLVGFQNAFYLMAIGTMALIAVAAHRQLSMGNILVLAALGLANLFTMASGLLAPLAACVVVALRQWQRRDRVANSMAAITTMLAIVVFGAYLIPTGVPHGPYAIGIVEHARALLLCMSWPLVPFGWPNLPAAAIFWLPVCIWLVRFWRTRQASHDEIFAVGMAAWVFLQFLAIAHARGHDMTAVYSRYGEIPAIGLTSNFWLALKFCDGASRRKTNFARTGLAMGVLLAMILFWQRMPDYLLQLKYRSQYSQVETWNVRRYFAGHPLPVLTPGTPLLPYPDVDVLRQDLADAGMQRLLPSALFDNPDPTRRTPLSMLAAGIQRHARTIFPTLTNELGVTAFHADSVDSLTNASNGMCSLDWIDTDFTPADVSIYVGDLLRLTGWYTNTNRMAPPEITIQLLGDSQGYSLFARPGDPRPDIAQALASRNAFRSGFSQLASTQLVHPGKYHIALGMSQDPKDICDTHRSLIVLP